MPIKRDENGKLRFDGASGIFELNNEHVQKIKGRYK
jgi:hypothetical protein